MTVLFAPAKTNLFLAILGKDDSGYHEIDTVFVRLPQLQDRIEIQPAEKLTLTCSDPTLSCGEDNLILKAIRVLEAHTDQKITAQIHLEKHIPIAAGLGGGSSDAAAVLLHFGAKLPKEILMVLAEKVGMDVPFFVSEYAVARGTHYGEKVTELPALPEDLTIKIHPASQQQKTKNAFEKWDEAGLKSMANIQTILSAIHAQDAQAIHASMHNDFMLTLPHSGLPGRLLSGSGAAEIEVCLACKCTRDAQ